VDGPWRLTDFTAAGNDTFVPNPAYSGSPKPTLSEFKLVNAATDAAEFSLLKEDKVTVGRLSSENLPPAPAGKAVPSTSPLGSSYTLQPSYQYGIHYYIPNFNNPVIGPAFRQLYVRQALEEVEDQPAIDAQVFHGYSVPGAGPIPPYPANMWEPAAQKINGGTGPYPYSISAAQALLTSHGWRESGGVMTCENPGTGPADCGAGIPQGRKLAFTLDWATGIAATGPMMDLYRADAAKAGIDITLVSQSFQDVLGEAAPCSGPKCSWDALYYGLWVYNGPGFEPTGEALFQTGAGANAGSYSDPVENSLINATHTNNSLSTFQKYASYTTEQLPFIWMPDQYAVWAVSDKLHNVHFNPLYTFLPEYWYYTR
jgi:peptide/nickel transport system substrate-binding protein